MVGAGHGAGVGRKGQHKADDKQEAGDALGRQILAKPPDKPHKHQDASHQHEHDAADHWPGRAGGAGDNGLNGRAAEDGAGDIGQGIDEGQVVKILGRAGDAGRDAAEGNVGADVQHHQAQSAQDDRHVDGRLDGLEVVPVFLFPEAPLAAHLKLLAAFLHHSGKIHAPLLQEEIIGSGDHNGNKDRPDDLVGIIEEDRVGRDGGHHRDNGGALFLVEHIPGDARENQAHAAHHAGDHSDAGKFRNLGYAAEGCQDHHKNGGQKDGAYIIAKILFDAGYRDCFGLGGDRRDRAGERVADGANQVGKASGL